MRGFAGLSSGYEISRRDIIVLSVIVVSNLDHIWKKQSLFIGHSAYNLYKGWLVIHFKYLEI